MKAFVALLALIVPVVYCGEYQRCQPDVGQYLQCMSGHMKEKFEVLEDEYGQSLTRKAKQCFSQRGGGNKCVLKNKELKLDLGHRRGPLRGCRICRPIARLVRNAFLNTKPRDLKCIRDRLRVSIKDQLTPCLKGKLGADFVVPDLPDFAAGMDNHREKMVLATTMFINMASRAQYCRANNAAAYDGTESCLNRPQHNLLKGVCHIQKNCKKGISNNCIALFPVVKGKICDCIDESLVEIKQRVNNIKSVLEDILNNKDSLRSLPGCSPTISNAACHCAVGIKKQLKTPEVNWFDLAKDIFRTCITGAKPRLTLDRLLELGCDRAFKSSSSSGKKDLQIAFIFVNQLVEAIADRVSKVCKDGCPA